jgi:ribosomal protein L37AE/L43A
VYVEDLCVAGLGRTRLAKSVHDAGWSAFAAMLKYKAARHGRTFGRIGRFEPTSQVCSACGVKDGPKPLSVRMWTCGACGAVHDRDLNAARNVLTAGRAGSLNACGGTVRPGLALAGPGETGTLRGAAWAARQESPRLQAGEDVNCDKAVNLLKEEGLVRTIIGMGIYVVPREDWPAGT